MSFFGNEFFHLLILQAYGELFGASLLIMNKGEKTKLTEVSSFCSNKITSPRRDFLFVYEQNLTVKLLFFYGEGPQRKDEAFYCFF